MRTKLNSPASLPYILGLARLAKGARLAPYFVVFYEKGNSHNTAKYSSQLGGRERKATQVAVFPAVLFKGGNS